MGGGMLPPHLKIIIMVLAKIHFPVFFLLFAFTCSSNMHNEVEESCINNDTIICENNSSHHLIVLKNDSILKCSSYLYKHMPGKSTLNLKGPIKNIIQNLLQTTNMQLECKFFGMEDYFELYYTNKEDSNNVNRKVVLDLILDRLELKIEEYLDTIVTYEIVIEDTLLLSKHKAQENRQKYNLVRSKYYDLPVTTIENLAGKLNQFNYDLFITTNVEDSVLYNLKFKRYRDNIKAIARVLRKDYGLGIIKVNAEIPFYIIRKKQHQDM